MRKVLNVLESCSLAHKHITLTHSQVCIRPTHIMEQGYLYVDMAAPPSSDVGN